jgi:hypothetical protein
VQESEVGGREMVGKIFTRTLELAMQCKMTLVKVSNPFFSLFGRFKLE